MESYTIVEMSRLLNIPESTARYYRDRHPEYFHYTGKGRKKRYNPETLEALRFIAEQATSSRSAEEIEEALQARFNREINTESITAVTTAEAQQSGQLRLIETLSMTLKDIADQKKEIQDLRKEIKAFKKYIKNRLSLPDKKPNVFMRLFFKQKE